MHGETVIWHSAYYCVIIRLHDLQVLKNDMLHSGSLHPVILMICVLQYVKNCLRNVGLLCTPIEASPWDEQDRQFTYNVTYRRVRLTFVAVEK
jgi:hypothetical protein